MFRDGHMSFQGREVERQCPHPSTDDRRYSEKQGSVM
jgi:hypothetical protein